MFVPFPQNKLKEVEDEAAAKVAAAEKDKKELIDKHEKELNDLTEKVQSTTKKAKGYLQKIKETSLMIKEFDGITKELSAEKDSLNKKLEDAKKLNELVSGIFGSMLY